MTMARGTSAGLLVPLTLVYGLNFVDRQIVSLLAEPIRRELGLSDAEIGLLSGTLFALFYATLAIPASILSQRWRPGRFIAVCVVLFSGATALCGAATNFLAMACGRMLVGIGEAGTAPVSVALIIDQTAPQRRGRAIGLFTAGAHGGLIIGFVLAGFVATQFGWRVVFLGLGGLGLAVALFAWTQLGTLPRAAPPTAPPLRTTLHEIIRDRVLMGVISCWVLSLLGGYGILSWLPAWLVRVQGLSLTKAGMFMALGAGLLAGAGTIASGMLADRLSRRSTAAPLMLAAAAAWIGALTFAVALQISSRTLALALVLLGLAVSTVFQTCLTPVMQARVEPRARAPLTAIVLFLGNLLGLGLGPLLVGALSDALDEAGRADALAIAMTAACAPLIAAGFFLARASRAITATQSRE
jgi:predicted MFS family arabinose efflux permease